MPVLTPVEHRRRWLRLPGLLFGVVALFPLALIAVLGPVDGRFEVGPDSQLRRSDCACDW